MSAFFSVTVRTPEGDKITYREEAPTNRDACRQVLMRHPGECTVSARIEDQADLLRSVLAERMSGFPLIGGKS